MKGLIAEIGTYILVVYLLGKNLVYSANQNDVIDAFRQNNK